MTRKTDTNRPTDPKRSTSAKAKSIHMRQARALKASQFAKR